jgi:choline-sulfatase
MSVPVESGGYAAISYVDARIGEVLSALGAVGFEDDTIVLFCADHGEMLGERGLWYKMAFFEASAQVPLIVRAPGRLAPGRVAEPVSLLDVAPTVLHLLADRAAGEAAADMDGASLRPLLNGDGSQRGDVVAEYLAEGVTSPAVMLRRGRHITSTATGTPTSSTTSRAIPASWSTSPPNPATPGCATGSRARSAGTGT